MNELVTISEFQKLRQKFNKQTGMYAIKHKKEYTYWLEQELVNNINYNRCCVNNDSKETKTISSDKELIDSYEFEDLQLCGKSNCTRPKLGGSVYCSYHHDINFG